MLGCAGYSRYKSFTEVKAEQLLNILAHPYLPIPDRLRFSIVLMPLSENAPLKPYYPTEIGVEGRSTDDKLLQPLKASYSPLFPTDFKLGNLGPLTNFPELYSIL